jgi:hypothetical protein
VAGSVLLVRTPEATKVQKHSVPFLVASALDTPRTVANFDGVLVAWWVPPFTKQVNFRGGKKKDVLDVFGTWEMMETKPARFLRDTSLPDPVVHISDVLEANFELTKESTIPYHIYDALRLKHGIDVTGLAMSLTRGGNLYRSYALLRGRA